MKRMKHFFQNVDFGFSLTLTLLLVAASFVVVQIVTRSVPEQKNDPGFMLECVYEWGQTPQNCRKILLGEDPPALPYTAPGC